MQVLQAHNDVSAVRESCNPFLADNILCRQCKTKHFSRFSSNSETLASELPENLEEMLLTEECGSWTNDFVICHQNSPSLNNDSKSS